MALPLVGLFFFRLYENQLIRQTEAELIAQSAARRRSMRRKSTARLDSGLDARRARYRQACCPTPATRSRRSSPRSTSPPTISCGGGRMRKPAIQPAQPAYVEIGARLTPIIRRDPEDDAGRLSAARSPGRRHRRAATRSGSRSPHIEEVARRAARQYRAARCATACPTSRRRRSIRSAAALGVRVFVGTAGRRQRPRRRRDLPVADAQQHLQASLWRARQVRAGGDLPILGTHR